MNCRQIYMELSGYIGIYEISWEYMADAQAVQWSIAIIKASGGGVMSDSNEENWWECVLQFLALLQFLWKHQPGAFNKENSLLDLPATIGTSTSQNLHSKPIAQQHSDAESGYTRCYIYSQGSQGHLCT